MGGADEGVREEDGRGEGVRGDDECDEEDVRGEGVRGEGDETIE